MRLMQSICRAQMERIRRSMFCSASILINVFKNPDQVMANIFGVTEYLRSIIREAGGDLDREALSYIKTKSGESYFEDADGQPWRCLHYGEAFP